MKQSGSPRRSRSRSSDRVRVNNRRQYNESDNKIRGNVKQVLDKYLLLARDAHSLGDRVAAEGYYQHADHYHRLVMERALKVECRNEENPKSTGSREPQRQTDVNNSVSPENKKLEALENTPLTV